MAAKNPRADVAQAPSEPKKARTEPKANAPGAAAGSTGVTTGASPTTITRPPRSLSAVLDHMAEASGEHEQYMAKWVKDIKSYVDAELLDFL